MKIAAFDRALQQRTKDRISSEEFPRKMLSLCEGDRGEKASVEWGEMDLRSCLQSRCRGRWRWVRSAMGLGDLRWRMERDDFKDIDIAIYPSEEQLSQKVVRCLESEIEPRADFDVRILNHPEHKLRWLLRLMGLLLPIAPCAFLKGFRESALRASRASARAPSTPGRLG
jgi:hypothetical protein